MELKILHESGQPGDKVNLMFFSDGYIIEEKKKFFQDALELSDVIVAKNGSMAHVSHLLNVYAVFVPSSHSGLGHDHPLPHSPFGLYRPGPELRAVYVGHAARARTACKFWRDGKKAGCDNAILLGNDPLYGGLGGEFTVITASKLNGGLVLQHELGHSLIPVGEEYEGGYVYCGVNSDSPKNLHHLKWADMLTTPDDVRIEDARVPLQAYPWHDLSSSPYTISFTSSSTPLHPYPSAFLRLSLSSIPQASHVNLTLNEQSIDLTAGFPPLWEGSKDRRWVELPIFPLSEESYILQVALTDEGRDEPTGKGGKMLTSVEIIEYGRGFRHELGFVGAFPTYSIDGRMSLRPTNEDCVMRRVNEQHFCPICSKGLQINLEKIIQAKRRHVPYEIIKRTLLRCR
ncbi:hypothetical protein TREMEDRAFT_26270 [Tremella mesenterica DSM 1558]|uniref:uncharacterized protein n=1 Tax=Tremella mesenterica (strain ATCC 24925 / CBS 8224 / DSM 1558 / NBRC 9311 / NRRL Y-6157 / RJB 2259-6 / UBC 559-6) TaxID=578456 RepID=UPI0003F49135|nr:uncharacterized protein TREMEDRAFT_26270 [Tremella mesenterica DSM 1558]EIW73619.1 hypothetical protein TREMEDRAFT_26270 [Tremella mesenterica DSM 1558]